MKVYCPRCGQEQASPEIRFCSRCGFLMTGVATAVLAGGLPTAIEPTEPRPRSARVRGLRQGGGLFLAGIFFVPLLGVLSLLFRFPEEIIGVAAIVFFVGGFVRLMFALLFESGSPADMTLEDNVAVAARKVLGKTPAAAGELPPSQSIPAESYTAPGASSWRDTNDLTPVSVIDNTTKLLNDKKNEEQS